jgi:hypothetical protein
MAHDHDHEHNFENPEELILQLTQELNKALDNNSLYRTMVQLLKHVLLKTVLATEGSSYVLDLTEVEDLEHILDATEKFVVSKITFKNVNGSVEISGV